jgi:hypothetical protein
MMEAARTSETSVDNYFTRQYIPEDKSELHIRRSENLKAHKLLHAYFINSLQTMILTKFTCSVVDRFWASVPSLISTC